jgi:hypothetical protein
MRIGSRAASADDNETDRTARLAALVDELVGIGDRQRSKNPVLASVIESIAGAIREAGELPPAALDEHLFALESLLLDGCFEALDEVTRRTTASQARARADATSLTPEAGERAFRAHRDRLLRELLALPRLEV